MTIPAKLTRNIGRSEENNLNNLKILFSIFEICERDIRLSFETRSSIQGHREVLECSHENVVPHSLRIFCFFPSEG